VKLKKITAKDNSLNTASFDMLSDSVDDFTGAVDAIGE
jgi:hypothetical protein